MPLSLLLVAALACTGSSVEDTSQKEDSASPGFVATADLDAPSTLVATVRWTTDRPGVSHVEYADGLTTPETEDVGTAHAVALYGLAPDAVVPWRAVTEIDGVAFTSEGTVTTGALPDDFPGLKVTVADLPRMSSERFLVGGWTGGQGYGLAVDRVGLGAWYLRPDWAGLPAWNVFESVAALPAVGEVVAGAWSYQMGEGESFLVRASMAGEILETWDAGQGHHEVQALPDGTVAWWVYDNRPWTDPGTGTEWILAGDALVERAPDGTQRTVFSVWDAVSPVWDARWDGGGPTVDWSHANTFFYSADTSSYLCSFAGLALVLEVDRASGEVLRSFGRGGDYPVGNGSTVFTWQHNVNRTPTGTLLMTSMDPAHTFIFAVEYALDEPTHTLREVWSFGTDGVYPAEAGGEAWRLSNGDTLFNMGTRGLLQEVTPAGDVVWEATWDRPGTFYRLKPVVDLYSGF